MLGIIVWLGHEFGDIREFEFAAVTVLFEEQEILDNPLPMIPPPDPMIDPDVEFIPGVEGVKKFSAS